MTIETLAHVRPEPIEAPEPQPRRIYTQAEHEARVEGWQHLAHHYHVVVSFPAYCESVDVAQASLDRAYVRAGRRLA